jgi:hypothetical protein
MKKKLSILFALALFLSLGFASHADAVTCPSSFPTSLSNWFAGCTIPSSWANALEEKIGINGSASTTSLDYQINGIFTSYGSEIVASSAVPWLFQTSTIGLLPVVSSINNVTGTVSFSVVATSSASSFTTSTGNVFLNLLRYTSSSDITVSPTGTILFGSHNVSQFTNDSGYLTSSTRVTSFNGSAGAVTGVSSFNGATGTISGVGSFNGATGTVTGVGSLVGTTNQVNVSNPTGTVTLSLPQSIALSSSPSFAAIGTTSTSTPSWIADLGSAFYASSSLPSGYSDFGSYWDDICTWGNNFASSTHINIPQGTFSYAVGINNTSSNGGKCWYSGQGDGTVLAYNGSQGSFATQANGAIAGTNAIARQYPFLTDLTLKNLGSATTTNPTVGVEMGGGNGAAHLYINDVTVIGFGKNFDLATNTYDIGISNTISIGGGYNFYATLTANAGEAIALSNFQSIDCANASTTQCVFINNNGIDNLSWVGGLSDDSGIWINNGGQNITIVGINAENPGHATYGSYDYLTINNSANGSMVTWIGGNFQNDATSSAAGSPTEFVNAGGNISVWGASLGKTSNATSVPEFINDTIGSGNIKALVCGVMNQNNTGLAVTSIFKTSNTTNTENQGCLDYNANNFIQGVDYTTSLTQFFHGGGVAGTINSSKAWDFGSGNSGTTTIDDEGSFGIKNTASGGNSVLTALSPAVTVFTNASWATTTLPTISSSQNAFELFINRGSSSTVINASTTAPDFVHLLTNATATGYTLLPGSPTLLYNDGTYWDQILK